MSPETSRPSCRTCGRGPLVVFYVTRRGHPYCPDHRPKTGRRFRIGKRPRIWVGITDDLLGDP